MNITASAIYDEQWGYAAILLTRPGCPKQMLATVVIEDDDAGFDVNAADLADEFITWMENPENGYDVDTWNPMAWDHAFCYREFLRRRQQEAA